MKTGKPGRLLTRSGGVDSLLGFLACLFLSFMGGATAGQLLAAGATRQPTWLPFAAAGGIFAVEVGLYLWMRAPVPAFARGWRIALWLQFAGVTILVLLLLGLLAICGQMLKQWN